MKKQFTLLLLIFLMAACGGNSKKNDETSEDSKKDKIELKSDEGSVSIDGDEGKMTIETEDGSKVEVNVGENQSLPDGFPKNIVPIYKNSKVIATSKNLVDEKESFLVSFGSADSVEDIVKFYKSQFSKKEIKTDVNMNDMSMLAIEKDGYTISIQVIQDEDDGKSATTITVVSN